MKRQQPLAQGDLAVLEDRANGNGELLTASAALPHAGANVGIFLAGLRSEFVSFAIHSAMRANRGGRPAQFLQILPRLVLIAKMLSQFD